jgi:glycosyltransferase involved in cell wall biosynthesis
MTDRPRIAMIAAYPTQLSAPMYRYLATIGQFDLVVYFTQTMANPFDHELGFAPAWGIALDGYPHRVLADGKDAVRTLSRVLSDRSCDAVVVSGWADTTLRLALVLGLFLGAPLAVSSDVTPLSSLQDTTARLRRSLLEVLLRRMPAVLATGSQASDYYRSLGVAAERIFRVPYVVDNDRIAASWRTFCARRRELRGRLGIPEDATVLLAVLKFVEREGVNRLAAAFSKITRHFPAVWLVIVGDGPLRGAVRRMACDQGLSRLILPGYQQYAELPAFYALSDALVHPGVQESWGVSINEAMVCGLPVIASDRVGASHDLVVDGQSGLVYDGRVEGALECSLAQFATMPHYARARMGACAQITMTGFGYECVTRELRRLVAFLARHRSSKTHGPRGVRPGEP